MVKSQHDKQWFGNETIRAALEGPFYAISNLEEKTLESIAVKLRAKRRYAAVYPREPRSWLVFGALKPGETALQILRSCGRTTHPLEELNLRGPHETLADIIQSINGG